MKVVLKHTKQKKQIGFLKSQLEKFGWEILGEWEMEIPGKPQWSHLDEIPNLIASWSIETKGEEPIGQLDFIAHWDWKKNETLITDCSHCQLRNTGIKLEFFKDTQLGLVDNHLKWEKDVAQFCEALLNKMKYDEK